MRKTLPLLTILFVLLLLAACGGTGDVEKTTAPSSGGPDLAAGEELFARTIIGSQAGCATCHSLEPDTVIVGPSMAGIGSRAANSVPGLSAEEYIRQSILEPDAHVVEGFVPGLMVQVWQDELSQEQLDDLVAYLLSLK